MKPLAYITAIWFATAMLVHRADAGQLQPYNVQTQLGTSQVGMTETQGDTNVVIGVLDGSGKPEVTDSTGQQCKDRVVCKNMVIPNRLVAFFFPNVEAGYHLITMTGVSRMVVIEYKKFNTLGGSSCGGGSFPPDPRFADLFAFDGGYYYSIPPNYFKNELFVIIQLVNTPDARIAPSLNTEVYDQMGTFVVQDAVFDKDPAPKTVVFRDEDFGPEIHEKIRELVHEAVPQTLLTKQKSATISWITLTLRAY
jgi:hypothetical protein